MVTYCKWNTGSEARRLRPPPLSHPTRWRDSPDFRRRRADWQAADSVVQSTKGYPVDHGADREGQPWGVQARSGVGRGDRRRGLRVTVGGGLFEALELVGHGRLGLAHPLRREAHPCAPAIYVSMHDAHVRMRHQMPGRAITTHTHCRRASKR